MANLNKMLEAFEHFVNNDSEKAKAAYRQFFIETAQDVNRRLDEADTEEEFAAFDADESDSDFGNEDESEVEAELDAEGESEAEAEVETEGEWADVKDRFDELETLFAEFADELDQYSENDSEGDADVDADDSVDDFFGSELEADEDEDDKSMMEGADLTHQGDATNITRGKVIKNGAKTSETTADSSAKSVSRDIGSSSVIKARKPFQTKEANVTGSNSGNSPDGDLKGNALPGSSNVRHEDHGNVIEKTKNQFTKVKDGASKRDVYSDKTAKSSAKQNNK